MNKSTMFDAAPAPTGHCLMIKDSSKELRGRHGGKVFVSRRRGLPFVTIQAGSYHNLDGEPLSEEEIFKAECYHHSLDLTPDEAIHLGDILMKFGEDCKKCPDRRSMEHH